MLRAAILRLRVHPPAAPNDPGRIVVSYVLWAKTPRGCEKFFASDEQSAFLDAGDDIATALASGAVVERQDTLIIDLMSEGKPRDLDYVKSELEQAWTIFQDSVNDHDLHVYGTAWGDDGSWKNVKA